MTLQASRTDQQGRLSADQSRPWGQPGPAAGEADGGAADTPEPVSPGKWSPRATLLFILVTCGLFWAVVALAAHFLLKR